MMRKELWVPLVFVVLSIAFVAVSLLVVVTRGRSASLIRKKLALGAMILSLTGTVTGTGCLVSCYEPPPECTTDLSFEGAFVETADGVYRWRLTVDPGLDPALHGEISHDFCAAGEGETVFSYRLVDPHWVEIQRGDIVPEDGAFDDEIESFSIELPADLAPGEYRLRVHTVRAEEIDPEGTGAPLLQEFVLTVVGG